MIVDLYIYYCVAPGNTARLRSLVLAMQSSLADSHQVTPALKRRPENRDGKETWMEIYPYVTEGFEPVLEQAVAAAGLMAWIDGERHIEHFVDVAPCA